MLQVLFYSGGRNLRHISQNVGELIQNYQPHATQYAQLHQKNSSKMCMTSSSCLLSRLKITISESPISMFKSPREALVVLRHMYILSVWHCYRRIGLDKTALILPEQSVAASKGTWWKRETSSLTFSSGDWQRYILYSLSDWDNTSLSIFSRLYWV